MKNSGYHFVLDCSVTMAWCFEDEGNEKTMEVLQALKSSKAIVPSLWPLEVSNVLLIAGRKKRVTELQTARLIDALASLPIVVDQTTAAKAMHSIFLLAKKTDLTVYDAAYLELAIREEIPLATLDAQLIKACKKMGVPAFSR